MNSLLGQFVSEIGGWSTSERAPIPTGNQRREEERTHRMI
jgi:hypothetical protein